MDETERQAEPEPGRVPSPASTRAAAEVAKPAAPHAEDDDDDGGSATSLLKWLVPSFTIYLVAIGFIIQSAREDLLGVPIYGRDSQSYLNSSADFLRDVVIGLIDGAAPLHLFGIVGTHPWVFAFGALVTALVVWNMLRPGVKIRWRLPRSRARRRSISVVRLATLGVILFVVLRLAAIDVPVARIGGLVSPRPDGCWSLLGDPSDRTGSRNEQSCEAIANAKPYDRAVWDQAAEVAGAIICSRTSNVKFIVPASVAGSGACTHIVAQANAAVAAINAHKGSRQALQNLAQERARWRRAPVDQAYADLLCALLACALGLIVWRDTHSASLADLALAIALVATLTVPYVYGKVVVADELEYGELRIDTTLQGAYKTDLGAGDQDWVKGFVVRRDEGAVEFLTLREYKCNESDAGDPAVARFVTMSSVELGHVLSFDEVQRLDLIGWVLERQQTCSNAGSGGG